MFVAGIHRMTSEVWQFVREKEHTLDLWYIETERPGFAIWCLYGGPIGHQSLVSSANA
jgi:hypothetical protein